MPDVLEGHGIVQSEGDLTRNEFQQPQGGALERVLSLAPQAHHSERPAFGMQWNGAHGLDALLLGHPDDFGLREGGNLLRPEDDDLFPFLVTENPFKGFRNLVPDPTALWTPGNPRTEGTPWRHSVPWC